MNAGGAAFVEQTLRSNNCAVKTLKIDARHPVDGLRSEPAIGLTG